MHETSRFHDLRGWRGPRRSTSEEGTVRRPSTAASVADRSKKDVRGNLESLPWTTIRARRPDRSDRSGTRTITEGTDRRPRHEALDNPLLSSRGSARSFHVRTARRRRASRGRTPTPTMTRSASSTPPLLSVARLPSRAVTVSPRWNTTPCCYCSARTKYPIAGPSTRSIGRCSNPTT